MDWPLLAFNAVSNNYNCCTYSTPIKNIIIVVTAVKQMCPIVSLVVAVVCKFFTDCASRYVHFNGRSSLDYSPTDTCQVVQVQPRNCRTQPTYTVSFHSSDALAKWS